MTLHFVYRNFSTAQYIKLKKLCAMSMTAYPRKECTGNGANKIKPCNDFIFLIVFCQANNIALKW